jgi:hypothetical protein
MLLNNKRVIKMNRDKPTATAGEYISVDIC